MKYALIHIETGAVTQWQDHGQLSYADPPDGYELRDLPEEFEFPEAPTWWRDGAFTDAPPIPPHLPAPAPSSVTMRQARLALLNAGKLADVAAAIDALSSPQREVAQIEWEFAATVERSSGLVTLLADSLGLGKADLDALFVYAASK